MRMRTRIMSSVVGLAAGAALVGQAVAQQPVPTVKIDATPSSVAVDAAAPVPSGPTRFDVVRPAGAKDTDVYVALLVPGVTLDQLRTTLAAEDKSGAESALGLLSIRGSAVVAGGQSHQAFTFDVKPGLTYVVIAESDAESNGKVKPRAFTTFTSGADANGATAPAPKATVRMQGLSFKGAATLPQHGTVRFENRDGVAHFALAFPVKKGTTTKGFGKALLTSEAALGKLSAGPPLMAQSILSGGDTANDQELDFPTKGKYGLVCFIDGHDRLGMYRVVTVK